LAVNWNYITLHGHMNIKFGYCLAHDSCSCHTHLASNYFILVQTACPNLQRYHFFCYVFRAHSKVPAADAKCLCTWTFGVINLCYCNDDGMTRLESTEANYQIGVLLKRDGTRWRRERKWRGNWRMKWVASTLHTTSEPGLSSITIADARTSAASSRLNWGLSYLNRLIRFTERRNLISARVPSHFKSSLPADTCWHVALCMVIITISVQYNTSTSRQRNVLELYADRRMEDTILLHARRSAMLCAWI
jgi:hypothetical protein